MSIITEFFKVIIDDSNTSFNFDTPLKCNVVVDKILERIAETQRGTVVRLEGSMSFEVFPNDTLSFGKVYRYISATKTNRSNIADIPPQYLNPQVIILMNKQQ